MITRRDATKLLGAALGAAILLPPLAAFAQTATPQDLEPAGLGDIAQGPADARVTIIEYASLTCSHCAAFHAETYPELKKRYIDTGQVRFILREFPLDPLATAGFMLSRCDGEAKYYPVVDLLFSQQKAWAMAPKPVDALQGLMRQAGFSQQTFEGCLRDQKLYDGVNAVKTRAAERLKIDSTPTFFINGQRHRGNMSLEEIERVIKPMLGA